MKNPEVKLLFADLLDDRLVFVTSIGEIFVYKVNRNFEIDKKLQVVYVRRYNLADHFKPFMMSVEGKLVRTECNATITKVVKLEVVGVEKNNVRGEKFTLKKVGMQITIRNGRLGKKYDVVAVFDHLKSSYSAFDIVFSGPNVLRCLWVRCS